MNTYQVFELGNITWDQAVAYCESLGGHMATITSQEENDYVYQLITSQGYKSAYFGLTDENEEGSWFWVDGDMSIYRNWHLGEPNTENSNEDYAMFYYKYSDGTWNDGNFGKGTVNGGTCFICEWENGEKTTPTIAFGTINGLKWTLTNEGVLTISGSGLMGLDSTTTAPWLSHADQITEVVIEEGILDIGEAAFADCTNLTPVTISDSVYRIRQGTFKNCTALTSIAIPDGVSEVPAETFSGCASLAVVHIPRSLTAVGTNAFNGCASLKDIYYAGIAADFDNVNMDASATDNVEEFLNLNWHYLDEYYYSNIDPKIYEQMCILCDKPTYYGNSQTVDIVKDYRNIAIAEFKRRIFRTASG